MTKLLMISAGAVAALAGSAFGQTNAGPSLSNQFLFQNGGAASSATSMAGQLGYGSRTYGDTFNIGLLGQNTTSAFFLTSAHVVNTVYNGTAQSSGTLLTQPGSSPADSFGFESVGVDTLVQVGVFSAASPQVDLLPAGVSGGSGGNITALRLDMGTAAASGDTLEPYAMFNIISAQVVLFQGSTLLAAFNLVSGNGSFAGQLNQTALADVAVIGNAAGLGITEMDFVYHITPSPTPSGLALLGLGGLIVGRRRR